jgi:hypothetical protein
LDQRLNTSDKFRKRTNRPNWKIIMSQPIKMVRIDVTKEIKQRREIKEAAIE